MSGVDDGNSAVVNEPDAPAGVVTVQATLVVTQIVTADLQTASPSSLTSTALVPTISTLPTTLSTTTLSKAILSSSTSTKTIPSTRTYSTTTSSDTSISKSILQTSSDLPLPPVAIPASSLSVEPTTTSSSTQTTTSSPTVQPTSTPSNGPDKKQAVVGGLSGAIGGSLLLALLLLLCLRRRRRPRRRKQDSDIEYLASIRPRLVTKPSERSIDTLRAYFYSRNEPTPVKIEGNLIRMSLTQFERPFVQDEGWREYSRPGRLRVMNPDFDNSSTPSLSTEKTPGFFSRHPLPLPAVFQGQGRTKASSYPGMQNAAAVYASKLPQIYVDEDLSKECIVRTTPVPSFRSYPSIRSASFIVQNHLQDPFLTPPLEEPTPPPLETKPKRPGLGPLQGAASRTLSSLSNILHPFKRKSSQLLNVTQPISRQSVSTYSSRWSYLDTPRSDPFDLDRRLSRTSLQGPRQSVHAATDVRVLTIYEGT